MKNGADDLLAMLNKSVKLDEMAEYVDVSETEAQSLDDFGAGFCACAAEMGRVKEQPMLRGIMRERKS
jgi:hypothetical protein